MSLIWKYFQNIDLPYWLSISQDDVITNKWLTSGNCKDQSVRTLLIITCLQREILKNMMWPFDFYHLTYYVTYDHYYISYHMTNHVTYQVTTLPTMWPQELSCNQPCDHMTYHMTYHVAIWPTCGHMTYHDLSHDHMTYHVTNHVTTWNFMWPTL